MKLTEVRQFRRRLGRLLILERSLRFLALAGFVVGGAVLAVRVGLGLSLPWLPGAVAVVLIGAVVAAVVDGLKNLPESAAVRALLDRHQRRGGLLMADAEVDLGSWRAAPAPSDLPGLRWRSAPAWTLLSGAAVFVAVSFLVPVRPLDASGPRPLDLGKEIADLEESLEILEEEGLIDGEEAERLELALETLAEEASGEDPARAWETLDHLQAMAEQSAEEAAEAAFTEGERLAAAEQVAEALAQGSGPTEIEAEALRELAGLTSQAGAESQLLDQSLAEALQAAAESGDPGAMSQALADGGASLESKMNRLHKAGLIDLETLMKAKESLKAGDEALAAFLGENGLEASGAYCEMPGVGGVTRGRGDAAMTWADPSSREGAAFEEQILDPASLAALKKSGLIGLQAVDPRAGGRQPLPSSGASVLDPTASTGGAAYTQSVLPRHRGAVRRFFERGEDP